MASDGAAAAQAVVVSGPDRGWRCTQALDRVTGPGPLELGGQVVWESTQCQVGTLTDDLALAHALRCHQRSSQVHVEVAGDLPFGSQPGFHHQVLLGDRLLRVTTDLRLPGRTQLQQGVAIGSLTLRGPWTGLQEVIPDAAGRVHLGELAPLGEGRSWTAPPLALLLHHAGGGVLELGLGNDWWRWRQGVVANGNQGRYRLEPGEGEQWRLVRQVSYFTTDTEPEPRSYRYCWYAAWRGGPVCPAPLPAHLVPAVWQPNGKLDLRPLAELDAASALVIDADAIAWPPTFLRTSGGPCHACHGVGGRLRQAVRQLKALPNQRFAVLFRGLVPGTCTVGTHLDRGRELPHWDLGALLDFGHWTRHQLGAERRLSNDCQALPLPSLANLFQDELAQVAAQTAAW
jgi:hypothetical protein